MFSIDKLKRMRFISWLMVVVIVLVLGISSNVVNAQSNESIDKEFNVNENISEDFTDIEPGDWFYEVIKRAKKYGYVSGYPDGTFKPDNSITRAEFATLTNHVFNFKDTTEIEFSDVKDTDWFYVEIQKAINAEYLYPYDDGTFRPNDPMSRQEVAVILGHITELEPNVEFAYIYKDASTIEEWSKGFVGAVTQASYMVGYPDVSFKPTKNITRAESVTTHMKVLAGLPYAYVVNSFGTISVIQTPYNTVVDTIPAGNYPRAIEITPDGEFAYVIAESDKAVLVIRISDNTITDTISVGWAPRGIAITPDGQFTYVVNAGDDNVSVIRMSDNTVVHTIPVGDAPQRVAITPDSQFAYVTNQFDDNISVIRISDHTVIDTVTVGDGPIGIGTTPDGKFVYVMNISDANVSVIEISEHSVVHTIPVGDGPVAVGTTPNSEFAYVANFDDSTVSVIRISDHAVIDTIPVGKYPTAIEVTPDGEFAYVVNYYDDTVSVIELLDNTVVDTIPVGKSPSGIGITPIKEK